MSTNLRITDLSSDKRRLLEILLRERSARKQPVPLVRKDRQSNIQPVSFSQQQFWFLNELEPNSAFHSIPMAVRLLGAVDLLVLEKTFNEVIRRHEILRTIFPQINGQPVQLIQEPQAIQLPMLDLSDQPVETHEEQVSQLIKAETQRVFNLVQGPLFRAQVIRVGVEEHIILLTMHHIISDGWSMGVLINEVTTLYGAYINGGSSPLLELPVQYADYAVWQREYLRGEVLEEHLTFWKRQLTGASEQLRLPTDRPRPINPTDRGADESIIISEELSENIKRICRKYNVTSFMLLLAAYQTLLYRYTDQSDICIGIPVTSRNRVEIEELIGLFVNTLVLRTDLSGEPTFIDLLTRVKTVALNAYAHQDLPFEKLVENLKLDRSINQNLLFQVMFNLETVQQGQQGTRNSQDLKFEFLATKIDIAKYDVTLTIKESAQSMAANLHFNTDLFNHSTARRMLEHFRSLLVSIVTEPDQPINKLPLMTALEVRNLLFESNSTTHAFPTGNRLHDLFEASVMQQPDSPALIFENCVLTYDELNRKANQLAHYLRKKSVGPEIVVGVLMEHSIELIVAFLGVLKAGGACLPIDPMYPGSRIGFMLSDANVLILLTQKRLGDLISDYQVKKIYCDTESIQIIEESDEKIEGGASPDNTAYVLYTSGSTGTPKGVLLPHRGLVNRMLAGKQVYPLTEQGCFLHKTTIGFDVSIWETYYPFLLGGQLVVAAPGRHTDTAYLGQLIEKQQISFPHFVPSILHRFLQEFENNLPKCIKGVFCGGEPLPVSLMKRYFDQCSANLYNQYGPTEASISVMYHICEREIDRSAMSIGRPFPNNQIYLFDKMLQPVPIGIIGKLYIGGICLARGYLNHPELTAEKFIPHPYSTLPGSRLYHSGDLAKFTDNGEIEFIGRQDYQVKVGGARIELGEVETVLRSHPKVEDAIVIAESQELDNRLIAFIVAGQELRGGEAISLSSIELRRHLREQLPDSMIPTEFVYLKELPLMIHGKVDRRELTQLGQSLNEKQTITAFKRSGEDIDQEGIIQHTPVEEMLVGIWSQVMKLSQIGLHDNFFDLGGHSLLATQVMFRVRESLNIELPLRALFDKPTIAALGQEIESVMRDGAGLIAKPILPVDRTIPLPLSFAQQRLWFLDQLEPGNPFYNLPTAVRIHGPFNLSLFEQALNRVIHRHESLRTVFQQIGGTPVQIIKPAQPVTIPVTDLSQYLAAEREDQAYQFISTEAGRPFDLEIGPLFRVQALRLDSEEHIILSTMHHIISDGWSMGIMIREISTLYDAYSKGDDYSFEDLTVQYGDYAVWQRAQLAGEILEEQLAYWKTQLTGAPSSLELLWDHQRPVIPTYQGGSQRVTLNTELSDQVKRLCETEGVTLFMFLLAVFNVLLYRYTGQHDIVVGTPVSGRTYSEVGGLIGFFVNSLALRTRFIDSMTFLQLLKEVRHTFLDGYAHQETPFEKVVEELAPGRTSSQSPLFQVVFTLQNGPPSTIFIENLTLSPVRVDIGTAKFDLTLVMVNTGTAIHGSFEYNTDLFEAETIEKMAGHFQQLILSVVTAPGSLLKELEMFSAQEKHLLNTPLAFEELDQSFSF